MVIGPVVSEILGGVIPTPQMLLHCQKEQMLLMIYRPVDLFHIILSHLHILQKFHDHTPSSSGGGTTPLP